jgi:hypothetical protein
MMTHNTDRIHADTCEGEQQSDRLEDTIKKRLKNWGFKSYGFDAGVVLTKDLDTGFGFGAQMPKQFFHPLLELTPSIHFWGTSNDSLDVYSAGIEESLTIIKTHNGTFYVFSGLTFGYYYTKESLNVFQDHTVKMKEISRHSFETYLTIGSMYNIGSNRAVFTQCKYCLTQDSYEVHFLLGLNFYL